MDLSESLPARRQDSDHVEALSKDNINTVNWGVLGRQYQTQSGIFLTPQTKPTGRQFLGNIPPPNQGRTKTKSPNQMMATDGPRWQPYATSQRCSPLGERVTPVSGYFCKALSHFSEHCRYISCHLSISHTYWAVITRGVVTTPVGETPTPATQPFRQAGAPVPEFGQQ